MPHGLVQWRAVTCRSGGLLPGGGGGGGGGIDPLAWQGGSRSALCCGGGHGLASPLLPAGVAWCAQRCGVCSGWGEGGERKLKQASTVDALMILFCLCLCLLLLLLAVAQVFQI